VKLLLDTCIAGRAVRSLRASGHDVVWAGEWPEDPGDERILERASTEGRVLVTLDRDFGELAVLHRRGHAGIVRLVTFAAGDQGPICVAALAKYERELQQGAIVTVEPGRVRVRPRDV
jgi:predicted nuclease of predicted toxin-antitoxin system